MQDVLAMILAGGQGDRLSVLSEQRAKPAVVFGGQYRIIDFALSNCANSALDRVAVLTQYRPRSLVNHIGAGRAWGYDSLRSTLQILQPYLGRADMDWYQGTADAVYQNLYVIEEAQASEVLILAGDQIYLTNYRNMLGYHRSKGADATVGVYSVPMSEAHRFGVLDMDEDGRIIDFEEKPRRPRSNWISMSIYIFNRDVLVEQLQADADDETSNRDFGRDIIPRMYRTARVYAYPFSGYWRDVGTVETYWQSNMDLVCPNPPLRIDGPDGRLWTAGTIRPPARFGANAAVQESLISPGAQIDGRVIRSVISPGVVVEAGAEVRDSVVHHGAAIRSGARVDRCIIDKEVTVGAGAVVGEGDDTVANFERPDIVHAGISIIGKRVTIPRGFRVGRNVVIGPGVATELDEITELPSGSSMHPRVMPLHLFV
jgi:glucose-1-phosphate adenylyltransferase